MLKVLDLFAGSCSMARAANALDMFCYSSDISDYEGIDYVVDIHEFDAIKIGFIPDVIWASPPCTGFSVVGFNHHWKYCGYGYKGYYPSGRVVWDGLACFDKTLQIINYYKKLNPALIWYIENPRGLLRKMYITKNLPYRHTVTYCQYGDIRMKPTDIWTNNENWESREMCRVGADCHISSPRGSHSGTLKQRSAFERSRVPHDLLVEVLKAA